MQATTTRPRITATADGEGVVSHAGSRLLADVADRTTLTGQLSEVLCELRRPQARHDPGRVLVDMAVAIADGATTIYDVAALADQAELFGAVASDSTCWRLLDRLDGAQLGAVARARAAWLPCDRSSNYSRPGTIRDHRGLSAALRASRLICDLIRLTDRLSIHTRFLHAATWHRRVRENKDTDEGFRRSECGSCQPDAGSSQCAFDT
ncbi:transposase [Actinomycetes bacterium KLBMP 9759]